MERKDLERLILKTILFLIIAVLIIMHFDLAVQGLFVLIGFMSPMLLGFAIAFVINIILTRLERIYFPNTKNRFLIKSRRPVCILLSLLIILAVIAFVVAMVVPELIGAFRLLSKEIAASYDSILEGVTTWIHRIPPLENWLTTNFDIDLENPKDINWETLFTKLAGMILGSDSSGQIGSLMDSTVNIASSIGSAVVRLSLWYLASMRWLPKKN